MEIKIQYFKSITNEITLSFNDNNAISLIGENGSGKTNILDAIYHIIFNTNDGTNLITSARDNEDYEDKLKISYVEELSKSEIVKVNSFLKKYNINKINAKPEKNFYENINTLYSNSFSIENSYYYLLQKEISGILNEYLIKYPDLKIIEKIEFLEKKNYEFYEIKLSKLRKLKTTNIKDYSIILSLSEDIDSIKKIFYTNNLNVIYSKNAENENNIDFLYDFSQYETDNATKLAIDFFLENPKNSINIISSNNDGTIKSEKNIDNEKHKIKTYSQKKIEDIFSNLNIYASPLIDIDGNNLKIHVEPTENYKVNDFVSTQNNSSGYKSVMWILLKFEQLIFNCDNNNNLKGIFILDEPDKNLHPFLQQQMINYMIEKIKNTNVKLIYTTHSPFLINETADNYIVSRDSDGATIISDNKSSLYSIYPKILNTKLMESPIFKYAPKGNIIFVDEKFFKNLDLLPEIKQYISSQIDQNNFEIVPINISDKSNSEAIPSLKKLNEIIDLKLNTKEKIYYIDDKLINKIKNNNEKN